MQRLCATERLFIPDMFPDMEKAIFMDTDLIFLRCSMCVVGGLNAPEYPSSSYMNLFPQMPGFWIKSWIPRQDPKVASIATEEEGVIGQILGLIFGIIF